MNQSAQDPEVSRARWAAPLWLHFDFFDAATEMDWCTRIGLYGFVLNGYLLTLFGTLLLVVELSTGPAGIRITEALALAAALFVCVHLFLEARSTKRLSMTRWNLFGLSIFELAWATWTRIHDPTGRRVFLCVVIVGGLSLLGARLVVEFRSRLRRAPLALRMLVMLVGWMGLSVMVGIWFI